MEYITSETIQQLLSNQETPKVTAYIPMLTTASPPHVTENQIRLKNNLQTAIEQLAQRDDGEQLSKELQDLQNRLYDDMEFWSNQTHGLLICATPGNVQLFHLPIDTEEYVAIDDSFHLAPIIALAGDQRDYYVLSVAQHNPTLYKGDMYGLHEADITLPADAGSALGIDEPNQKSENQGTATGSSMNTDGFNGRGGARNPQDQDRVRFFRIINDVLMKKLDRSTPVILAGVDSDVAEFRQLARYPSLLESFIGGNHNHEKPEDMFPEARAIAWRELVMPEHKAAIEEYERLHGANPERVAHDNQSVLAAAEQGRIDKLLARLSRQTTDTVQDAADSVMRITFPEPEQGRTIHKLAAMVYQMSGKVINLQPNEMPDGALMVARLRY